MQENLSLGFMNSKGADQPVHPRSPISAYAIHLIENIESKLATSELAIFQVISVAPQFGLRMAWLENLKTDFLRMRRKISQCVTKPTV